jgi:hypothetical protein
MKTIFYSPIIYLSIILLFSCTKKESAECPEDLACTEVFVSINVQVKNTKNENVHLFKTITEIEGDDTILVKTNFTSLSDNYVIVDDLSKKDLKKAGSKVTFKGFDESNQLIVNEEYLIGHDCCHVIKLSGKDIIIIN